MNLTKGNNDSSVERTGDARLKSIKPVMFEYAHAQKPVSFDEVSYDYIDDVNKLQGKSIVECSKINAACLTKTKVQRESDDSSNENLVILGTKTDIQREVDDTPDNELVHATTKTFVERESDDGIGLSLLLLTKTEAVRETDD